MIRSRVAWMIVSLLVSPPWAGARAADPLKPEDLLKSRGLKKSGATFILAAEAQVQSKLNEGQRLLRQLNTAFGRQRVFEQDAVEGRRMVPELLQERILRNQQIRANNQQDVLAHNQLVSRINEINDQLRLIESSTADPRVKQEIDSEVAQRRAAYIQVVLDTRDLVDVAIRQYETLAHDDAVKTALAALATTSKPPPKLGPTRAFDEAVKQLARCEKSVLSKAIEMRRHGGVFEVDVTLNGGETIPMIFDTGASFVTLSAQVAEKIGLNPQDTDPTIEMHDATGGITPAKKMTIPSVRVGPFTVNNVDCAVMPAAKRNAPLLLGQSFINQFTHKVDGGRLLLSRVEANEPQAKSARSPAKKTRAKRSTKSAAGASAPAAATDPDGSP